jgi:hypothetical protein
MHRIVWDILGVFSALSYHRTVVSGSNRVETLSYSCSWLAITAAPSAKFGLDVRNNRYWSLGYKKWFIWDSDPYAKLLVIVLQLGLKDSPTQTYHQYGLASPACKRAGHVSRKYERFTAYLSSKEAQLKCLGDPDERHKKRDSCRYWSRVWLAAIAGPRV